MTYLKNSILCAAGNSRQMKKILSQGTAGYRKSADYRHLDRKTACLPQVSAGKKKNDTRNASSLSWKDEGRKKPVAGRKRRTLK